MPLGGSTLYSFIDAVNAALEIQASDDHWAFSEDTGVVLGKVINAKTLSISEPDTQFAVSPYITLLTTDAHLFPNGIVLDELIVKATADITEDVILEIWTDPQNFLSTVVTASFLASDETSALITGSLGRVPPNAVVKISIPNVNIDEMHVAILYH